jgi:uncharacterized protein YyaL (SSP411 family)
MAYAIENFYHPQDHLFYYSDKQDTSLISRKKEIFDNVIPSYNSLMALNLWQLGTLLSRDSYRVICHEMLSRVKRLIPSDPAYMSNWATAYSFTKFNTSEVVIGGKHAEPLRKKIASHFHPHKVTAGSSQPSSLPLLKDRVDNKETKIYVCYNKACQLPTNDPEVAISQLIY